MSVNRDCGGCAFGDHSRHNPAEGLIPGLLGGTHCGCRGDCAERFKESQKKILAFFSMAHRALKGDG